MIYTIQTLKLTGATFQVYKPVPFTEITDIKKDSNGKIKEVFGHTDGSKWSITPNNLYELSERPYGYSWEQKYLPYTATVTEDLPASVTRNGLVKAKEYKDCKLMSETHGGYLQFYHKPTDKILRIAMNSHYYDPSNQ